MAKTVERTYNVPLRKEYLKAPRWKRTNRAVSALRSFLVRHMKSENVLLGKDVNDEMWKHGLKNPPHHIKVTATKDDKGTVRVHLFGKESAKKGAAPTKPVAAKKEAPQVAETKTEETKAQPEAKADEKTE